MRGRLAAWVFVAVAIGTTLANTACSSCQRDEASREKTASSIATSDATITAWPAVSTSSVEPAPRPGMAWIPAGTLRVGTSPERTPRVADEEMAGAPIEMGGFYIDLLPWPNEPNAIPTSNVTREEAEQHCASKGKRLCTELEWERACKGPDNTTYEYGDVYRKDVCGTGVALEQASRRPTGEHAQCKSAFGVAEMHGGVWEWTSSAWGRGSRDAAQGVLRGGNSVAGELVGRCSNAIARSPSKKSPTMGLRCCAGAKNAAEVTLDLRGTPGLTVAPASLAEAWAPAIANAATANEGAPSMAPKSLHAWSWIPVANEKLVIVMGCTDAPRRCALLVGRPSDSGVDGGAGRDGGADRDGVAGEVLATIVTGNVLSEVARLGSARHLRMRSLDPRGVYSREITYVYGRVDVGVVKRP